MELGNPDIVIRPDSVQAARMGLTEQDVEMQLNAALYGQVAATMPEQDRMTKIRVRYPDKVRYNREGWGSCRSALPGGSRDGHRAGRRGVGFVPLAQLASIRTLRSPSEIWRENQQPVMTVSAEPGEPRSGSGQRGASQMAEVHFPSGYRWELAGNYRTQQESFPACWRC